MQSETLERWLKYLLIGGVFLIPLIPFLVTNSLFFPFITGKNFFFRILIELLAGSWLLLMFLKSEYRPRFSWITWVFAFFLASLAVSNLLSHDILKSFLSNFERMEGWVTLAHLFLYTLILSAVLSTERLWLRFWSVSVGASVLMGLYSVLQFFGLIRIFQSGVRLEGTFGNASYLAVYMLFHVFITLWFLTRERLSRFWQVLYGAALLLQLFVLYHTATRGAILGLLGGLLLTALLIALFGKERPVIRKASIGALAGVLVIVGGFLLIKDSAFVSGSPVLSRFASISTADATTQSRLTIWQMALKGAAEKPVFGWGQESFNVVFNKYYEPSLYRQEMWFDRVHNTPLDWLIAGGALGLLGYLGLFLAALYYLWRYRSAEPLFTIEEKALFTGMLAAYFFHNLFVFDNLGSYLLFFAVLGYISTRAMRSRRAVVSEEREVVLPFALVPAAIVLTLFAVYLVNGKGILTARELLLALTPRQAGAAENLPYFTKAQSYGGLGAQEAREQFAFAAQQVLQSPNVAADLKQQYFSAARGALEEQLNRVPDDARIRLFLASLLRSARFYDASAAQLAQARELSPKKQAVLFEIVSNEISRGDYAAAREAAQEAYELDPSYGEARLIYAVALIYAGEQEAADVLLEAAYGTTLVFDDRILRAYVDAGVTSRVVSIWEKRVTESPSDARAHLALAAAYLEAGRRSEAVREIERSIELDSSFREQGTYYINEIRAGRNP